MDKHDGLLQEVVLAESNGVIMTESNVVVKIAEKKVEKTKKKKRMDCKGFPDRPL